MGTRIFVGLCVAFCNIFMRKHYPQITHANHMTTSLIVYILLSTCQWVHMALAINGPGIFLMQDNDEKPLQNYSCLI